MQQKLEPKRTFDADLHTHVDFSAANRHHGMHPKDLAHAIVTKQVDICTALEHNSFPAEFFNIEEEVERLLDYEARRTGIRRQVMLIMGNEMNVGFEGHVHHVGYNLKERYNPSNVPRFPERIIHHKELENLAREYPAAKIHYHPTSKSERRMPFECVRDFMESGLVDGVELLNGAVFDYLRRVIRGGKTAEVGRITNRLHKAVELYGKARISLMKEDKRLAATGNSDAHDPWLVGSMVTRFEAHSADEVFDAIEKTHTQAICRVNGLIESKVKQLLGRNGAGKYIKVAA